MARIDVKVVKVLRDNYVFLLNHRASGSSAVVDPGIAGPIVTKLDQLAWRVRKILCTHHHADHTGNTARFVAAGTQVIGHEQLAANLKTYQFDPMPAPPSATYPDRTRVIALGGVEVRLLHLGRAHTGGDTFVFFPAQRVLATGDAYTLAPDTPQLVDYAGGGSAKDWPDTIERALQLEFDRVVPGHGTVVTKADMKAFQADTLAVRTKVHDMIVQKKTKDEIWAMLQRDHKWNQFQQRTVDGLLIELQ